MIGEIGETAAKLKFMGIGYQFTGRDRLEAGIDGIAEAMDENHPTAMMIAVQVKATRAARYTGENDNEFTYTVRAADLEYWRGSNLPVILVLYRQSDDTFYWKSLENLVGEAERTLRFDKKHDLLDRKARDRLAALTVAKQGHGYYVPPLGGGEQAIVNMLPILLPAEIFVSQTRLSNREALAKMNKTRNGKRYDWMINETSLWTFHDPLKSSVRDLVERDQVERIETDFLALHDAKDQQHKFAGLLRHTLAHDFREVLGWDKEKKQFFFLPKPQGIARQFQYLSAKQKAKADVVSVYKKSKDEGPIDYVRHHSFTPRFERLAEQWYLVVSPSYFFTADGTRRLSYPETLLSGKKRLDNNNTVRRQVIMWHRLLSGMSFEDTGQLLVSESVEDRILIIGEPPVLELPKSVPDDVWGAKANKAKKSDEDDPQGSLL
ncbi:DUF4365 domain-containing protein [Phaeobacter inhibens]|uniref:DUF4365 domain-containing protein n=1 Tax=Phaeobacter inhibens TaxID=221822 RepID=UPI0021A788D5|nr:DUF4365 domain-containing protein [Phaeobacter inhibens]